jgi:hypothetical protein
MSENFLCHKDRKDRRRSDCRIPGRHRGGIGLRGGFRRTCRNGRRFTALFSRRLPSGDLTDETSARQNALNFASPAFDVVLNRFPKTEPMIVMGLIEVEKERLFNTDIVVDWPRADD